MTLPLPHPVVQDHQVQQNFEVLTQQFPIFNLSRVRFSWGLIKGSDGSKLAGSSDYTSSRGSAGVYTISWSSAKIGTNYAILLSCERGVSNALVPDYFTKGATAFSVSVFSSTTGTNADPTDWAFLVVDGQ